MIRKLPILIVLILFFFGSFVGSTTTTVAMAGNYQGIWAQGTHYPNPFEDDGIWMDQSVQYPNPFVVQDSATLNTESSFYTSQVVNTSANTSANTYRSTDGMEALTATCEWSMTPNQFIACEDDWLQVVRPFYFAVNYVLTNSAIRDERIRAPNQSNLGYRVESCLVESYLEKMKWQAQKFTLPGMGLILLIDHPNSWHGVSDG